MWNINREGAYMTIRHFKLGEHIIKEKDVGETVYIIQKGRVSVSKEEAGEEIHICDLGAGSIFGEMSMIDDKPRSASVTAVEDTVVKEIHRDSFFSALQNEQELAIKILKVLFERLRKANAVIAQIKAAESKPTEAFDNAECHFATKTKAYILLEGLTSIAAKRLPENPFRISQFPFLIGRKSSDPLAHNDLVIEDQKPYRISRHHIELDKHEDRIFALDRGSHLGSIVDGKQLGGPKGKAGPLTFQGSEGILVLGDKQSPYRYKVVIK